MSFVKVTESKKREFNTKGMQKIKDFGEWLLNYILPNQKWLTKCSSLLKTK